jgi:hypothetical protein
LEGLHVTISSTSKKEKVPRRPLVLPQPHAGTNTDQSPGPAGLLGQDSEKRPGKVKGLAAASTPRGDQRRAMAPSLVVFLAVSVFLHL